MPAESPASAVDFGRPKRSGMPMSETPSKHEQQETLHHQDRNWIMRCPWRGRVQAGAQDRDHDIRSTTCIIMCTKDILEKAVLLHGVLLIPGGGRIAGSGIIEDAFLATF